MKVKLAPSLMCMDLLNIGEEIKILEEKSDFFHIDIIDWHYVKNMSFSPCFMDAIQKVSDVKQDVHLYVDNIDFDLVDLCIDSGAEIITMPPEVIEKMAFRLFNYIHKRGKKVGIFINPATPLEIIKPYIKHIDVLLIMNVDPGFAGQEFIEETLDKIRLADKWRIENGYSYLIEADGGCNEVRYRELYEAGTDIFVLGNSGLFGKHNDTKKALDICVDNIEKCLDGIERE